ncbi:GNAT family N-acetyltransferase [Roseibium sp.]|uniref:GNAT family N-acetyltransferase n=1 Tax=Roseibium sp. TaxID=1936156 RepID=UPI003A973B76
MIIPKLETERLILRPQTHDDWPAYRELMMSERAKGMGGPHAESFAWGMFCHDLVQWQLFEVGALMVDYKTTGRCVGQAGINSGPLFPEYELGWFVYGEAEGKGYAFEAASVLRTWALKERKLPTLVSYIDKDNLRSRALAERLGASVDVTAESPDPEDLVYRHW